MKILFVDDFVPWRKLLVELFKEDGSDYEIRQAGDSVEAMGILSHGYMPDTHHLRYEDAQNEWTRTVDEREVQRSS